MFNSWFSSWWDFKHASKQRLQTLLTYKCAWIYSVIMFNHYIVETNMVWSSVQFFAIGRFGLYDVDCRISYFLVQNNAWGCNASGFLCLWTHWRCGQPDPVGGSEHVEHAAALLFLVPLQPWSLLQSPMVCCHLSSFRELENYMIWFWSRIESVVRMRLCSKSKWAKETAGNPARSLSYCCIFMFVTMLNQPSEKSINSLSLSLILLMYNHFE